MPEVRIAERRLWVGDASRALLSGEVHFWRLDPAVWPDVLDRVRDLGLDIVSTYVCWQFHELAVGAFDFDGMTNPRRNLLAFLDLAASRGFWVLLRPGPYIYAEWPNSGIPDRTVQWHRLHPRFCEEARLWMAAVVEATRDRLATQGGPVALWQADNEADPWLDVYAAQLGLASTPGLFQDFLERRYAHIAALNTAWSSDYADFPSVRAVLSPAYAPFAARYVDVVRFRHWFASEVVQWTTAEYRRLGVDVPIYTNTYINTYVQNGRALESVCDLAGPDIYPSSRLAQRPDEHRGVLDAVRYARGYSRLPFVPEFESGIWHGWHAGVGTLSATHYELNALTALQAGAAGWNWYMLASRDSWYMSPITELGRFRPDLSPAFETIVRLFRALDPSSLEKLCDTAVTFDALDASRDSADQAVLRALYDADLDYDLFDLDSGWVARPLLLYASRATPSTEQLRRLRGYVEAGGTLVCFQPPPLDGLTVEPSAITTAAAPQRLQVSLGEACSALSSAAVFVYPESAGEPILAERLAPLAPTQEGGHKHVLLPVGERLCVGYVARHAAGRLIVLGVAPDADLLVALHAWLGVRVHCRGTTGAPIHSALFERGVERFVFVTNTAPEPREATLRLDVDCAITRAFDLRAGVEMPIMESGVLVRVPASSGTALRLS
jgi:hypothetical protein